jgi:PAS domain S-box-containing protein
MPDRPGIHAPDRKGTPALIGLAAVVGVGYFFAARLSLALLTTPDGVAVFWPAAGLAAGAMIALGPWSRVPVALGVMAATLVANLTGDRSPLAALTFALCNAGETTLIAWLIGHFLGPDFSLDNLRRVLGFFLAAGVATALSGVGGAAGFALFHASQAPVLATWLNWFASDAIGVAIVAPLAIGVIRSLRDPPSLRELLEGLFMLSVLSGTSAVAFFSPTDYWFTILPFALTLPLLIWPAARCLPVFTAAALFIIGLVIVWTLTFGIGRLGDSHITLEDRTFAAQIELLGTSMCALVLAALFAERRRQEAALKESSDRLQLALAAGELGVWSLDLKTAHFQCDLRHGQIHRHTPGSGPQTPAEAVAFVHPDDRPHLGIAYAASQRTGEKYKVEYRLAPTAGKLSEERWVAVEGAVVRGRDGQLVRLLGVSQDITARKQVEERLQRSERASRDLLGALPAAIYVTDAAGHIIYCNQTAVDLWKVVPVLGKDKWDGLAQFRHADGTPMAQADCPTQIALKQGRIVQGQEAIIERRDGSLVPIIPYPTPLFDEKGSIAGVITMTVDISERKKAELALAERNAQFALAAKAALVGSHAYDVDADNMQVDQGYAALHGLPDGTTETTRSEWRLRAHPEDVHRVNAARSQALQERRGEHAAEYRIIRSGGEVRWIESRSFMSYNRDGSQRVIGINIDVTERKRTEEQLRILIGELDHRVKNALATVNAVISRTQDATGDAAGFVAALRGRIQSMAATHQLLSHHLWNGVPLSELIQRELIPYATGTNTAIEGTEVTLSAKAGQALSMVLHELATNAAKHGALSVHDGRVSVRWQRRVNGNASPGIGIEWQETGGPSVRPPNTSGYGMEVIHDLIPYELGGKVDLAFDADGLRCQLDIPTEWLSDGTPASGVLNGAEVPLHTGS